MGARATRAKAQILLAGFLSGFENPLPRTKVQGYTWTEVFPQPLKPEFIHRIVLAG
jgi:hypothetical protein